MNQTLRTRIKICGITAPEAATCAINAGADALGLVFYEPSPRNLSIEMAKQIAVVAHPFVTLVGLFVDADKAFVEQVLAAVPIQCLQFHGEETSAYCDSFGLPYIKAIRVGDDDSRDLVSKIDTYASAQAVLLDTYKKGVPGGTGEAFNWSLVPAVDKHIVLAGGLEPGNVANAISEVKPYAVDTSGGVESAPGIKDPDRIRAFVAQVLKVDFNANV